MHRCTAEGALFFQLSFLTPNSLRRIPHRHFGLRITMTCIFIPAFLPHPTQNRAKRFPKNQSASVSTTTSAPARVVTVMQSEPSAYSLLTPSG